ncbi:hypothetical protein GOBAR_DD31403 [Gossypium barbadense]|nr:hypothetical protein GOBAR_DD31403 [Gossypium barbadense]
MLLNVKSLSMDFSSTFANPRRESRDSLNNNRWTSSFGTVMMELRRLEEKIRLQRSNVSCANDHRKTCIPRQELNTKPPQRAGTRGGGRRPGRAFEKDGGRNGSQEFRGDGGGQIRGVKVGMGGGFLD